MRRLILAMLAIAAGPGALAAQTSIYGLRGLGYPGRFANARARGLGGTASMFDGGSPLNPATVAGFTSVSVGVMAETDVRSYTIGGVEATGLSATRFPLAVLGGPIGSTPLSFAVSYAQYTERSYDLQQNDTLELRGERVGFVERTTSRGGMSDLRGALAYRLGEHLRIGAAFHILAGSAKLTFSRAFGDSAYRPYQVVSEESLTGMGASVGALWSPSPRVVVAVTARSDTRAKVRVDSLEAVRIDLPVSVGGGLQLGITPALRAMGMTMWRSWSRADADLAARAFDTWEVAGGLEFARAGGTGSRFPLRVGYRYATLPFSPNDNQPYEYGVTAGIGAALAGGRGLIDLSAERLIRRGAGASETAWQLSWAVTVRP